MCCFLTIHSFSIYREFRNVDSVCRVPLLIHVFFCQGAVSAGGNVPVHGFAVGPSWSMESAWTQSVCSGHHGCGMGKDAYIYCTIDQLIDFTGGTHILQQHKSTKSDLKKINTNNLHTTKFQTLQNTKGNCAVLSSGIICENTIQKATAHKN